MDLASNKALECAISLSTYALKLYILDYTPPVSKKAIVLLKG